MRVWTTVIVMALAGVLVGAAAARAADPMGEARVPLLKQPPQIDGVIDEQEWSGCFASAGFLGYEPPLLERRMVNSWVGADADTIYVAIRSRLPDEGALLAAVTNNSTKVAYDDSVEVYLSPTPDADDRVVYQFLANSIGAWACNVHKVGKAEESEAWTGTWEFKSALHDGWWDFEAAIPIACMKTAGAGRRADQGVWRINLTRNWKPDWSWTSLAGMGYATRGVRFTFTAEPGPIVGTSFRGDPTFPPYTVAMSVANPGAQPLRVRALLQLDRNNMPQMRRAEDLVVPPQGRELMTLDVDINDPTTRTTLTAAVTEGERVYHHREVQWSRAREPLRWVTQKPKDAPPVDLQFGYYPSRNLLRTTIDVTGLAADAQMSGVVLTVTDQATGAAVLRTEYGADRFVGGRLEDRVQLPELEGVYEVSVQAVGENVPPAKTTRLLRRDRFVWEGEAGNLGLSERVYPPFTPLVVEGHTLRTVLKTHTLNDQGLLDQVAAASANTGVVKPVLAAPMRYVVSAGGREHAVRAEAMVAAQVAAHRAVFQGGFEAGPLRARFQNTWDLDGTLRVELTLLPGAEPIDQLTLEVPLPAEAQLLHANSDRIRAPVVRRLPQGQGVLWDATALACDDFIRNFCPYIYVGSAVRGLCWFADNDRGWGWDRATPNVQVVRTGEQVVLRVHLVNQPTTIDAPRTLVFGVLAAPVKPPLNASDDPHGWRYRFHRDNYTLLGTDINWGGAHSCGSVYPIGGRVEFWHTLARASQGAVTEQDVQHAINIGLEEMAKYGASESERALWTSTVKYNLAAHVGRKMIFYYNRASSPDQPEFEVFKDEWTDGDRRQWDYLPGVAHRPGEIKITPTDSYIRYALYWYRRSFEEGRNQGVYWDNWFIVPSFNTEMTAAYQRGDGQVVPSAGIWQLRELSRRTFQMMNEQGVLPLTFPHMTSFSPLPMLAFATVQYDWEWKYGEGDVQDRFERDLLLLQSNGELAGVWPVPLHDHGAQMDDLWTQRTFSAVRIVHELDGHGG